MGTNAADRSGFKSKQAFVSELLTPFPPFLMQTFHPLDGTNKQSVVETHIQTYGKMDGRIVMNLFLLNIKVIIFCHIFHYLIKLFFTLEN